MLPGIVVYIRHRYTSRELIDILNNMTFADDYQEMLRFEHALISGGERSYGINGFTCLCLTVPISV